jgi:hypothetical protein
MNELQLEAERDTKFGKDDVLRCLGCGIDLADAKDVVPASRRPYMNPLGIVREIVVVFRARNVVGAGQRHHEFTWFPGHTWEVIGCAGCRRHVGWCFEGPSRFHGLLVEALR